MLMILKFKHSASVSYHKSGVANLFVQVGAKLILPKTSSLKFNFSFVSEKAGDNGEFQEQFQNNDNNDGMRREREKHEMKPTYKMSEKTIQK